jgi:hypothetical protein
MKKFGTPSGAGPGSANEKVGLAGVGTPGPVIPVGVGFCFAALLTVFLNFAVRVEAFLRSLPTELLGFLKAEVTGFVFFLAVDVVEEEDDEEEGVVVVAVGVVVVVVLEGVVVVTVACGVVELDGWQFAVTFWTGGVPGGSICAGGVPGGALTVKVTVWPSSRVAVTVHWSAEAVGRADMAITTSTSPTVVNATFSLWLIDTVACISSRHEPGPHRLRRAAGQAR